MKKESSIKILMADDDADDRLFAQEAFMEGKLVDSLDFVENGIELIAYLRKEGKYKNALTPDIVLLDINMPKMNGLEALKIIKNDSQLKQIPVIMLTTSSADTDITYAYNNGSNSYISKPVTFSDLVNTLTYLAKYWFKIVSLPHNEKV